MLSRMLRSSRFALAALVVGCAVLAAACGSGEDVEVQRREPAQQRTGTTAATTGGTTAGTATLDEDSTTTTDAEPRVRPDRPPRSTTTRPAPPRSAPPPPQTAAPPPPADPEIQAFCDHLRTYDVASFHREDQPILEYLLLWEQPLRDGRHLVPAYMEEPARRMDSVMAAIRPALDSGEINDPADAMRWAVVNLEVEELAQLQEDFNQLVLLIVSCRL